MNYPVKVFKLGGAALEKDPGISEVIESLKEKIVPGKSVFVHGGGGEITFWLDRFNMDVSFVNGQRVTDFETLKVVEMVLSGRVNKMVVTALSLAGFKAAGISGRDADTAVASVMDEKLGLVGEVREVNADLLNTLCSENFIPVISPVCSDGTGGALNVNADMLAAAVAASLGAEELNLITSTGGVLRKDKLLPRITFSEICSLMESGIVTDGMFAKLVASKKALEGGVKKVNMVDFKGNEGTVLS